jgi:hypothetical protein
VAKVTTGLSRQALCRHFKVIRHREKRLVGKTKIIHLKSWCKRPGTDLINDFEIIFAEKFGDINWRFEIKILQVKAKY